MDDDARRVLVIEDEVRITEILTGGASPSKAAKAEA